MCSLALGPQTSAPSRARIVLSPSLGSASLQDHHPSAQNLALPCAKSWAESP